MFEIRAGSALPSRTWRTRRSPNSPTARRTRSGLTPRQQRVLQHIHDTIDQRGYPPSMREIGEAVGLTSSSSVAHQLRVLEEKGYISATPTAPARSRCAARAERARGDRLGLRDGYDETGVGDAAPTPTYVPVVGRIAAGGPILAEERIEDVFPLPTAAGRRRARCSCSRSVATR